MKYIRYVVLANDTIDCANMEKVKAFESLPSQADLVLVEIIFLQLLQKVSSLRLAVAIL